MRLLTICIALAAGTFALYADPTSTQTRKTEERLQDMRLDERESTDSLAIPLDSSELEIDEEYEDLEAAERQNQHHNQK